ncbi:MAG: hypothetical protein KF819_31730 [Labilithrix sp.]|nr:hypothetical protein [Labilithrix sp.]
MRWKKYDTHKLVKYVKHAMPAVPFITRKKTSIVPLVLGAIGVAIAGGIAAVMIFSPRTRYRALDVAKHNYGKVKDQLGHLHIGERLRMHRPHEEPLANGLTAEPSSGGYPTSGL